MRFSRLRVYLVVLSMLGVSSVWLAHASRSLAAAVPSAVAHSFAFPASFANGLIGDLVAPIGTASNLHFEIGKVAVGELPIPMPLRASRGGRVRRTQKFARLAGAGPRARLLLSGVTDPDGSSVTRTGNHLVIDAIVSPSGAGVSTPPYTIAFDINDGAAFVDALLPIQRQVGETVSIQILGISVVDADGQPFGVLGLVLGAARATLTPRYTPSPGPTPAPDGACFVGPECSGPSFPTSQFKCCRIVGRPNVLSASPTSWCPPDQFDPATGRCAAAACLPCAPTTPPVDCGDRPECLGRCTLRCADGHVATGACEKGNSCACNANCDVRPAPTAAPCTGPGSCAGGCAVTCTDGTVVMGKCTRESGQGCGCSATCSAPTPCGVGQCLDAITGQCTGRSCKQGSDCPLPNQLCDLSGRRCACGPVPPAPHGRLCCECKDRGPGCFELQFGDVQPICPKECEGFFGQECDPRSGACAPSTPCATDTDCDDGNGCTIDRCTADGCTHDCVCVGPSGCGPGPGAGAPADR